MKNLKLKRKMKMQNLQTKNERGITLIALVVTIVVLLILAGISISIVLGEGGIIDSARKAGELTNAAIANEQQMLQNVVDWVDEYLGRNGKDDKTPGEIAGEGTEAKPFLIESIEDLVEFSNKVNSGTTYENQIVKLAVNLDFNSEDSYANDKNKMEELTGGTGFKSIGNDQKQFKGTFDGQNKTISNLYINISENYKGLFGYVGSNGTIKNLTISNANINCEAEYIGTVTGYVNGGTIDNIKTINGKVTGNRHVGGIVGLSDNQSTINNCTNSSNVTANGILQSDGQDHCDVGGIVGRLENSTILNSHNSGNVDADQDTIRGSLIGGISGYAFNSSIIDSCYNEGKVGNVIKENPILQIGGIIGGLERNTKVSKCYNMGQIKGQQLVGGIVGLQGWKSEVYIENCYNTGTIVAAIGDVGGISSISSSTTKSEIKNCYNTGDVSATELTNSYIRKHCRNS